MLRLKVLAQVLCSIAILVYPYAVMGDFTIVDPVDDENIVNNTSIATLGTTNMGQGVVVVLIIDGDEYDRPSVGVPPMGVEWNYTWSQPQGGWTVNDNNEVQLWRGQDNHDNVSFNITPGA